MDDFKEDIAAFVRGCDDHSGARPHMDLGEWAWVTVTVLALGALIGVLLGHLAWAFL